MVGTVKVSKVAALIVAKKCQDAYSCSAYTPAGWRQCAVMLAKRRFNKEQIEEVLRSKWTRWAGDGSSKQYGYYTSGDLARFLDSTSTTPEKLQALIDQGEW